MLRAKLTLGGRRLTTTNENTASRRRCARAAVVTRAGMNFGHEDFFDVVGTERDVEEKYPRNTRGANGLTKNQIEALGLDGDRAKERWTVSASGISARAAYAKEMPSDGNEPARYRTVMSGATMTHGGDGAGGRGGASGFTFVVVERAYLLHWDVACARGHGISRR